jgi:23S rRNA pseudouridine1911/1915/1917 synthase
LNKAAEEPKILYEDNHLIALFKPHRMLVQGDETGDACLMDWTKAWLKDKYQKPGNVFLGLIHRIDRPVAGVVLFGKTSKGASRLSEQIRKHEVKKLYRALVEKEVAPSGHLIHELEGKKAELKYRRVNSKTDISEVEVELITGRKHQIRSQFSLIGHPVLGDTKYGSKVPFMKGSIALMAESFSFTHPTDPEKQITVKVPDELRSF